MPQNAYINQAFLALGIDCLISQEKFCSLSHIIYPFLIIFYSALAEHSFAGGQR